MFNKVICNELTKAKRLANLIEEVGNHLAILFEQDNLEMEHFELSEGQTGWVYAIKLKDNDVDFSGVVDYGTCVERLVLNIYEDVWNNEISPEPEMEDKILLNASVIDTLNAIRHGASKVYRDNIPEIVTPKDIPAMGDIFKKNIPLANEFVELLLKTLEIPIRYNYNIPEHLFVSYDCARGKYRIMFNYMMSELKCTNEVTMLNYQLISAFKSTDGVKNLINELIDKISGCVKDILKDKRMIGE